MNEQGGFSRVQWSPRADRPWCPGATLPGPVGSDGQVETGWTTFFKLQSVLGRRRPRAIDPKSVDDVASPLPGAPQQSQPAPSPTAEFE